MADLSLMLTDTAGPVVIGEKTLRALAAIRKLNLLPLLYERPVVISRRNHEAAQQDISDLPDWLQITDDLDDVKLPDRCQTATVSEAATIRLGVGLPASVVLLEGAIKERAKLSFIKCEGTLPILVNAYREGHLNAVRPMVKALKTLGHGDVLPEPVLLEAMWTALDALE